MAPDPPNDARRSVRDEEGVVRPDELDYTASERVAELSDGRYVVATDNDNSPSIDDPDDADDTEERGQLARQQMARYLSDRDTDYGFVLTAAFEGEVGHHELLSDDVVTAFGDLASWYVDQIDTTASKTEALGILLLASETRVSYPTKALASILSEHDLTLDDSIGDLVTALSDDGLQIPPDDG